MTQTEYYREIMDTYKAMRAKATEPVLQMEYAFREMVARVDLECIEAQAKAEARRAK